MWQLHIDVDNWPSWQEAITEAQIDGPFEPGNSFDWSSYRPRDVTDLRTERSEPNAGGRDRRDVSG
jgi:hypothetical protein